jgi:hypothetical protein
MADNAVFIEKVKKLLSKHRDKFLKKDCYRCLYRKTRREWNDIIWLDMADFQMKLFDRLLKSIEKKYTWLCAGIYGKEATDKKLKDARTEEENIRELLLDLYILVLKQELPKRIEELENALAKRAVTKHIFHQPLYDKFQPYNEREYNKYITDDEKRGWIEQTHDVNKGERGAFVYICLDSRGMIYVVGETFADTGKYKSGDLFSLDDVNSYNSNIKSRGLLWYYISEDKERRKWKSDLKNVTTLRSGDYITKYISEKWGSLSDDKKGDIVKKSNDVLADAIIIPVDVNMLVSEESNKAKKSVETIVGELLIELGFPILNFYSHCY